MGTQPVQTRGCNEKQWVFKHDKGKDEGNQGALRPASRPALEAAKKDSSAAALPGM